MVPSIEESDIAAVSEVLRSGQLVQGARVRELEEEFASLTGAAHAVAASNGTATLHLILTALGIGPGDEVIVPAFSFIASANSIVHAGATPVFVDIQPRTFNLDPRLVEAAITERTKAIMVVHEFGLMADMTDLLTLSQKHNLTLIEDAACALGATDNSAAAGSLGLCGSFSLHPRKAVTSGEGGVIVINDGDVAEKLRILRNHGISSNSRALEFVAPGYNFRLTDIQAALALGQIRRFDQLLAEKRRLASCFLDHIRHPLLELPFVPTGKEHSWQTFHLMVKSPLTQAAALSQLRARGIGCNLGAQCIPAQTYYRDRFPFSPELYPHAWDAWKSGVAIPLYAGLSQDDSDRIITAANSLEAH